MQQGYLLNGSRHRFNPGASIRCWLTVFVFLVFSLAAARTAQAQTGWKLVWSDEFNGPAGAPPNPADWKFEAGPGQIVGGGNQESETYCAYGSGTAPCKQNVPNAYLDGKGQLVIVAIRTGQTVSIPGRHKAVPLYTSARLDSLKSFRYGRVEASIRVPTGQGVWPAFWALGEHDQTPEWPAEGEMDIMESWNPQPGTDKIDSFLNHGSLHGPMEPGSKQAYNVTSTYTFPQPMAQTFHQFAVEWSPGEVDFFCDGNLYSRQSVASLSGKEVWELDNAPFYLLLNLAMGGGFFGYPDATTGPTPTMVVDYVRVYQRQDDLLPADWGNVDIGGPAYPGYTTFTNNIWTVAGSGYGIQGHVDQFQFAYQALAGDGDVSARVLSQSSKIPEAEGGIMIRDGRGSGAPYAMLFRSPNGTVHFRARGRKNEIPGDAAYTDAATWMKIDRQGDVLTGYISADDRSWKRVGEAKLSMPTDILAGMISTSRDDKEPDIVRFDHVEVTHSDAAWDGAPALIPGVVQAEQFDTGGAGYSYSPTMTHKGPQPFRADEGPKIKQITTHGEPQVVPGGYYLSDLPKGAYLNYSVIIAKDGNYVFHVRVASHGAGGTIHFNLDQKRITKPIRIPDTGGTEKWREVDSALLRLPAGQHTIALVVDSMGSGASAGNVDFFSVQPQ